MTTTPARKSAPAKKAAEATLSAHSGAPVGKPGEQPKEDPKEAAKPTPPAPAEAALTPFSGAPAAQAAQADKNITAIPEDNFARASAGNSGAGYEAEPPSEIETAGARTASGTVVALPDSTSPIEAPDAALQTKPEGGYSTSSTNPVAASAATRSMPGEDHVKLIDADGKELQADAIFDDSDPVQTYVTVKQEVYEVFAYPGAGVSDDPTRRETTRLMYPKGARVDRFQAERIKAAHKAWQEQQGS